MFFSISDQLSDPISKFSKLISAPTAALSAISSSFKRKSGSFFLEIRGANSEQTAEQTEGTKERRCSEFELGLAALLANKAAAKEPAKEAAKEPVEAKLWS